MDSFDRVEDLAQCMCEAAGGCWHGKGTKRAYWRDKAAGALKDADAADHSFGALPNAWHWVAATGWIVAGLAVLALAAQP